MSLYLKDFWRNSPDFLRNVLCHGAGYFWGVPKKGANTSRPGPLFICAAFRNNSGIGQGGRLYAAEMENKGYPVYRIDLTREIFQEVNLDCSDTLYKPDDPNLPSGGAIIIHANPPHFFFALHALGKKFLQSRNLIAYWVWEFPQLPSYWKPAFKYIDSIETPSKFSADILQKNTAKSVSVHPHVLAQHKKKSEFAKDGIVHCLFIFDAGPSFWRKNPQAVLRAFKTALKSYPAELTFKITNADNSREYLKFIEDCRNTPHVNIIERNLSDEEMNNLFLDHDIYLSLHRSEGFGLSIAQALNYGLEVVATEYGGNQEFMNVPNAHSVPLKKDTENNQCADIEEAIKILRFLAEKMLSHSNWQL